MSYISYILDFSPHLAVFSGAPAGVTHEDGHTAVNMSTPRLFFFFFSTFLLQCVVFIFIASRIRPSLPPVDISNRSLFTHKKSLFMMSTRSKIPLFFRHVVHDANQSVRVDDMPQLEAEPRSSLVVIRLWCKLRIPQSQFDS